ncbi:MAG TPA: nitrate- and nitrite sensing domain-containing protein, partial [Flavobacterium sp.]|nr:nitrate- and nitrite sensing domain-containing protein [Flavobacterium sp.]
MSSFIRKLPLQAKLMFIAAVPFLFLIFLTWQVYHEKNQKLDILLKYKEYVSASADITSLIDALQDERKFSFDYSILKKMRPELLSQRPKTDALIQKLVENNDPSLVGFKHYTRIGELDQMRNKLDSATIGPNEVMHFYSNTVFRLNTLNTIPPANTAYLEPVFNDLMSQKILSEMMTYLGIIRSNIYNVLHTREYMVETLVGTVGTRDIYESYDHELQAKASPTLLKHYNNIKQNTAFKPTSDYIDKLFSTFKFDDTYTAAEWWKVSDEGDRELRQFQSMIWDRIDSKIDQIYQQELDARNRAIIFLLFALVTIFIVVVHTIIIISRALRQLRIVAEKLSNGDTEVHFDIETNDVIGRLAKSILKICKNNKALAVAAVSIGKGDFDVKVQPRGPSDMLGNAIVEMKQELQGYSQHMEQLVASRTEELARSNEDLQQFAHVASHDLKEPLRKIGMFSNIIIEEQSEKLSEKGKLYLQKIELAADRMSKMIEGVLAYSTVAVNEPPFELVDLNQIIAGVEND